MPLPLLLFPAVGAGIGAIAGALAAARTGDEHWVEKFLTGTLPTAATHIHIRVTGDPSSSRSGLMACALAVLNSRITPNWASTKRLRVSHDLAGRVVEVDFTEQMGALNTTLTGLTVDPRSWPARDGITGVLAVPTVANAAVTPPQLNIANGGRTGTYLTNLFTAAYTDGTTLPPVPPTDTANLPQV